ncbi:MAG: PAS domain-containing protein, partial [Myxococcales bacterium]
VLEALPEVRDQGFIGLLDQVRTSGEPYVARDALVRLDRTGTGVLEDLYVDFVYQPLKNADGSVFGIMAHAVDTTQQVLARRRIEALAAERAAMLNQIADAVITIDSSGKISFANDLARQLIPAVKVGMTPASAATNATRVDGSPFEPGTLPVERALRGERALDESWLMRMEDGRVLRMQGSASPVFDEAGNQLGAVLTFRDITEQHRLQQRVELERNRLNQVFAQTPAAIMVMYGRDHVIEVANDHYNRITGNRSLIGQRVRDAFPDLAGQGLFELYDQVYDTGKPYVGNEVPVRVARFGRVDEAYFNFVYQPLLGDDGKSFGVMTHAVEVTDVVRARKEAEDRAAELVRLTRALEQSNRELDQFAYVASHDL